MALTIFLVFHKFRKLANDDHVHILIVVPLEAPLVSLFPLTPTSVNISWQKLSLQQARGTVVEYKIFYRKQEESAREIKVPGNILDHTLTGEYRRLKQRY